jgi:hypothetical protein
MNPVDWSTALRKRTVERRSWRDYRSVEARAGSSNKVRAMPCPLGYGRVLVSYGPRIDAGIDFLLGHTA